MTNRRDFSHDQATSAARVWYVRGKYSKLTTYTRLKRPLQFRVLGDEPCARWMPLSESQMGFTMAVPIDVATGPGGPAPESAPSVPGKAIEGRSLGQIAWLRLRQDKVALAGGIVVVFLILVAIVGPYLVQSPFTYHENLVDPTFSRPYGSFGGVSLAHPFGVEPI